MRKKITLVQRIGFAFGFIIACFFALSFISTLIISLLNPTMTVEFVKSHFIFSRFGVIGGFLIHIIGNLLFAAVAIFFALLAWKGFTSQGKKPEETLVSLNFLKKCPKCGRVHKIYYKYIQDPGIDEYQAKRGFTPIPADNKIICNCGAEIDLSDDIDRALSDVRD